MKPLPYEELVRLCIQGVPGEPSPLASNKRPQAEPIELSAVWQMPDPKTADAILGGKENGFAYRRDGHPNASSLAGILKSLHQADHAILTAQGMSALAAAALALLAPRDKVLLGQPVYGKSSVLFAQEMARWNIQAMQVPVCDLSAWKGALASQPRLAILETITNPRMGVPDIRAIAELCKRAGTLLLVDNTFATPLLCQPLTLGADLVMESLSKFVCGHSDAMLGLLCGTSAAWPRIASVVSAFGLASSPLDCWLTRRGLATLPVRLEASCSNAMALAQSLRRHPAVAMLDYPGLTDHPQHKIAESQFAGRFGNMLTLHLTGSSSSATSFIQAMQPDIPFCPSLGENQTTLSHPRSTSHRSYAEAQLLQLGISENTVRVSVGVESSAWLVSRFQQGLDAVR